MFIIDYQIYNAASNLRHMARSKGSRDRLSWCQGMTAIPARSLLVLKTMFPVAPFLSSPVDTLRTRAAFEVSMVAYTTSPCTTRSNKLVEHNLSQSTTKH